MLERRGVSVYRAIDDRHPGESLTQRIHQAIDGSDAVVILWSELASQSQKVHDEYVYAKSVGKKPCLIRFPDVRLPDDWDPDLEWLPLEGVGFPTGIVSLFAKVTFVPPKWGELVDEVAKFAVRERDRS